KPPATQAPESPAAQATTTAPLSPAVRRLVEERRVDPNQIRGTGKGGRLTKGDVLAHLEGAATGPEAAPQAPPAAEPKPPMTQKPPAQPGADVERLPMTRLRQRIA